MGHGNEFMSVPHYFHVLIFTGLRTGFFPGSLTFKIRIRWTPTRLGTANLRR